MARRVKREETYEITRADGVVFVITRDIDSGVQETRQKDAASPESVKESEEE